MRDEVAPHCPIGHIDAVGLQSLADVACHAVIVIRHEMTCGIAQQQTALDETVRKE